MNVSLLNKHEIAAVFKTAIDELMLKNAYTGTHNELPLTKDGILTKEGVSRVEFGVYSGIETFKNIVEFIVIRIFNFVVRQNSDKDTFLSRVKTEVNEIITHIPIEFVMRDSAADTREFILELNETYDVVKLAKLYRIGVWMLRDYEVPDMVTIIAVNFMFKYEDNRIIAMFRNELPKEPTLTDAIKIAAKLHKHMLTTEPIVGYQFTGDQYLGKKGDSCKP